MWQVTDSEKDIKNYTQFVEQHSPDVYYIVEHDKVGDGYYNVRSAIINLKDYSEEEIEASLQNYGVPTHDDPMVAARALGFERGELQLHTNDWNGVVEWENDRGINLDNLFFMNDKVQDAILEYLNDEYSLTQINEIVDYTDTRDEDYYEVQCETVERFGRVHVHDKHNYVVYKHYIVPEY